MQNQIPENWKKVKLGEVADVVSGFAFKSSDFSTNGIPVIKIRNIASGALTLESLDYFSGDMNGLDKYRINKGDILVSMTGSHVSQWSSVVGKITRNNTSQEFLMNQRVGKIKPDTNKIDNDFLYYVLHNDETTLNLANRAGGSANQANISPDTIKSLEIIIPDLDEQKKIAFVISAFDDKIEVNNKIAKTLEQMAQAIFKEWFVKFKFPSYEKAEFVDSELGRIPKGWEAGKIDDLIRIISGYPFSSNLYTADKKGLGVVTIKNVQDGDFITECDSFIDKEVVPRNMNSEFYLQDGDILLSLTGNVGRVCFVYGGKYLLNQRVAKLTPRRNEDLAFTYFLFRQNSMQNYLINLAKGSAQPNLSPVETSNISLPIPTKEILDQFNNVVVSIYKKLVDKRLENQKLAAFRDLLLPKLMNGEIKA